MASEPNPTGSGPTASSPTEADTPSGDESVVAIVTEALRARLAVGRGTLELAAAEARLAATSLLLVVAALAFVVALLFVCWLLLLVLIALGLQSLGWPTAVAVLAILIAHLAAAAALGLWIVRLTRDAGFRQTRAALRRRRAMHDATG